MAATSQYLYKFMSACSGNWRNTVYVTANGQQEHPGYLLAADRDGQPVVMAVEKFQQLTGERIDPTECCGKLTEAGFEALFRQYLLWHIASQSEHPLEVLCQNGGDT